MAYKVIKTEEYTYEGEVDANDIPCGKGKRIFFNEGIIEEGWFDQTGIVRGKVTDSDGEILDGWFDETGFVRGIYTRMGNIIIEADFDDELVPFGQGKITLSNGTKYEGEFDEDGWLIFEGDCQNGCGGRVSVEDGIVEEGIFEDGQLNGQGKRTWNDGDIEEGNFENGHLHGQGKVTCSNGAVFEGVWEGNCLVLEGNCLNGNGKRVFCCHYVEEGEYEDGVLKKGKIIYFNSGIVYEGEFDENGDLDGQGRAIYGNGTIAQGEFKEGNIVKGKITLPDGSVYEGVWADGELILEGDCQSGYGKQVTYFGVVEEGEYEDGVLIKGKKIQLDGHVEEGEYEGYHFIKGKKIQLDGRVEEGEFTVFGNLIKTKPYKIYTVENPAVAPTEDTYEGEKNPYGQAHGNGVMRYADGTIYEGEWEHGSWLGEGTFTDGDKVYKGYWLGVKNSRRVTLFDGERKAEGIFEKGKFTEI